MQELQSSGFTAANMVPRCRSSSNSRPHTAFAARTCSLGFAALCRQQGVVCAEWSTMPCDLQVLIAGRDCCRSPAEGRSIRIAARTPDP